MDCKRPHKYCALKQLFAILCILATWSCTWVKDDVDDCPYGFWLKLHYTYNMLDVEAAPKYVTDAHVYVYDADGQFVKRIYAPHETLAAYDYRVRVEGLPEGDYQFVVWSGIGNSQYAVSGDTQTIEDFRLSLVGTESGYAGELPALFHGYQHAVHYDDSHAVYDIEMMKNTNQLACLVVSVSDKTGMNPDDFNMKIVAANGTMNAYNQLAADTEITYMPFAQDYETLQDSEYGELHCLKFNMTTLRLMNDDDCRIILEKKSTGETIFDLSFSQYIGMVGSYYTNIGRPITLQEYLDRQDFYTIVFYLSGDLNQLIQLQVNSWRLRAYNHIKL